MQHERELDFFISICESWKIQAKIITENNLPDKLDLGIREILGTQKDYTDLFDISKLKNNFVVFRYDIFDCRYIFIPLPDTDIKTVLVVGPYVCSLTSREDIEKKAVTLSLSPSTAENIHKYLSVVPYIADDSFITSATNCLCKIIYNDNYKIKFEQNEEYSEQAFIIAEKRLADTESPLISIQTIEKAYEQENNLLNAISQGLVHKAENFFTNGKPSEMLESRITDRLRNAKNFLIVLNTLARKAVEQGGVHPIYIDSVSSDFAMRIETAKSTDECDELFYTMVRKYSRLVQKHSQKNYSLLVQKVITCIDTDITADLSLKTQAKLLNVNPSYLSTHFKKETGVTLTDYVNKKRVERAKQLLNESHMQIQAVAQSCGILDVNYFTKIFKKYTGITPKEYKNKKNS